MSIINALSLMACALAIYMAALSLRLASAPGWREQHWWAVVSLTAAAYASCDLPATWPTSSDDLVRWTGLAQLALGAVHIAAWVQYTCAFLGRRPTRGARALQVALLVIAASVFIPGAVFPGPLRTRPVPWAGVVYRDPISTIYGQLVIAALLAGLLALTDLFAVAWRQRVRGAGLHFLTMVFVCLMALNDALALQGALNTPYLIDVGFVGAVAAVTYGLTDHIAQDARALVRLRNELEARVEERTRELDEAQRALVRSEKLAALGQLSAGVAHEVNNPIAVVSSNLTYLAEVLAEGEARGDALACVREAQTAARRIASIVRQLLDAGRMAAAPVEMESVDLAAVAQEAMAFAGKRCPGARLAASLPEKLVVRGQETPLVQVLMNLIVNGAQATEGGLGRVEIRAVRSGARVQVTVEDDGAGMSEEVLRRAFEPFFSTKPVGVGTGLGLAVSRGIVRSLGGELALESAPGKGTRAILELEAALEETPGPVAGDPEAAGECATAEEGASRFAGL